MNKYDGSPSNKEFKSLCPVTNALSPLDAQISLRPQKTQIKFHFYIIYFIQATEQKKLFYISQCKWQKQAVVVVLRSWSQSFLGLLHVNLSSSLLSVKIANVRELITDLYQTGSAD